MVAERQESGVILSDAEETETIEGFDFPPPERKVVTQAYDLSVQTLVDQWDAGLLILPDIQREYIWDDPRASRLIESLLLNIPVPVVYFAETTDAKFEIIDGHQRIQSIVRFLKNELRLGSLMILQEYTGKRFFQLPDREQRFLSMRTLRAVIISADSHPNMKFEVFERLNTGSIALTAQELRNSVYRGTFNALLHELARHPDFRNAMGRRTPRKRMADEELVLRFLGLNARLGAYRPPLKRFLNEFMRDNRQATRSTLETFTNDFLGAVSRVVSVLNTGAFRVIDANGRPTESAINRALFDAEMLTFARVTNWDNWDRPERVVTGLAELFGDSEFDDSIRRATGDRNRLRLRVTAVAEALRGAGATVAVPELAD